MPRVDRIRIVSPDEAFLGYRDSRRPTPNNLDFQPVEIVEWNNEEGCIIHFERSKVKVIATIEYIRKQLLDSKITYSEFLGMKNLGYDSQRDRIIYCPEDTVECIHQASTNRDIFNENNTNEPGYTHKHKILSKDEAEIDLNRMKSPIGLRSIPSDDSRVVEPPSLEITSDEIATGKLGEKIVWNFLIESTKYTDDVKFIDANQNGSNSIGYDFEQYNNDELVALIEVKTTPGPVGTAIKLSASQFETALYCHLKNIEYVIYIVFNCKNKAPDIVKVESPILRIATRQLKLRSDVMLTLNAS